ncbi:hypothetical protein CSIM01_13543 [Colletotrichum simmondsii]|uniref:Fungal calcium binding protein domain-containing protein n=1 Tax=Colletotrichum simmondsii TaxID=703756 RepID=A0A135S5G7_9PEZI|nr:hypothetical protein CSIM01_13543 [Colletotrichum simmondsii]
MHFQSTTLFLAAAVIFQGVSAQFCTGPPSDCNFEDAEMPLFHAALDRCTVQRADLMTICMSCLRNRVDEAICLAIVSTP